MWVHQGVIDDAANDAIGRNFGGDGCHGHGTHCAGSAAGATYEERIALFADVSKEKSTYAVTERQVFCVLIKEEAKWWERLLREGEKKPANLHVDFDRWRTRTTTRETSIRADSTCRA